MDTSVLFGLLKVVGISVVPVALMAAFLHAGYLREPAITLGRRMHLLKPPEIQPAGPPLEKLAADLRRLGPTVRSLSPGIGMARQRGIMAAYDDALVRAAAALDVPTTLAELPEGLEHEAERLLVEHALEVAGLSWRVHKP